MASSARWDEFKRHVSLDKGAPQMSRAIRASSRPRTRNDASLSAAPPARRGGGIRTPDLLLPKQVRCRCATPRYRLAMLLAVARQG